MTFLGQLRLVCVQKKDNNMTNANYGTNDVNTNQAGTKPKTMSIDSRYKELYYQSSQQVEKESIDALKHKQVFWNYMMNVSMQNAIVQMSKKTACS